MYKINRRGGLGGIQKSFTRTDPIGHVAAAPGPLACPIRSASPVVLTKPNPNIITINDNFAENFSGHVQN